MKKEIILGKFYGYDLYVKVDEDTPKIEDIESFLKNEIKNITKYGRQ